MRATVRACVRVWVLGFLLACLLACVRAGVCAWVQAWELHRRQLVNHGWVDAYHIAFEILPRSAHACGQVRDWVQSHTVISL